MLSRENGWKIFAFAAVFFFAGAIRFPTFFLQHWQGDQSQYVALAMKYDTLGMEGLNLDRVEIRKVTYLEYPDWQFIYPFLLSQNVKGDFFKAYQQFGLEFNDMPLYYKSPLFPAVMAVSHRFFAKPGQPFVVLNTTSRFELKKIEFNIHFFGAQFWAVSVPFFASLGMVVLTFFFARMLFGFRVAVFAMFLMAIHPIDIVTSYKILAEDFVSFFVIAAMYLFYVSREKKDRFVTFLAGVVAGLALLAKQSSVLIFPAVVLYLVYTSGEKWGRPRAWFSLFRNSYLFWYVLGALLISAHWFLKVHEVYGTPFYQPDPHRMMKEDLSGWFGLVSQRPHAFFLFLFNIPYLCPPYIFGHFTFVEFLKNAYRQATDRGRAVVFLWLWVLPFLLFFTFRIESKEERYLLPVYPALAMLSAYGLVSFKDRLERLYSPALARIFVAVLLVATVAWSVPIGMETAFKERFLILEPAKLVRLFYHSILRLLGLVS